MPDRFIVEDREEPMRSCYDVRDTYTGRTVCTAYEHDTSVALCQILNSWSKQPGEIML